MELLLIVAFFGLLVSIVEIILKKQKSLEKSEVKEKSCPPHPWRYDDAGKMFCPACKSIPGSIKTSGGEYNF